MTQPPQVEQLVLLDVPRQPTAKETDEYYSTPPWVVAEFVEICRRLVRAHEAGVPDLGAVPLLADKLFAPGRWVDCCAGGVGKHGMPYAEAWAQLGHNVISVEKQAASPATFPGTDYFRWRPPAGWTPTGCGSNPPFSIACDFVERSLDLVEPSGLVVMLQKYSWMGSQERDPWWAAHTPLWVFRHPRRVAFGGAKSTDNQEYAHFVFAEGENPVASRIMSCWHLRQFATESVHG